jgi:Sulfotransferase domain
LPSFLVIGAMKAGTTSLWHYLRSHPQVFMPDPKELYFFSSPERFDRGIDWYRSNFSDAGAAVAVGEACTNYSKHPRVTGAACRIALVLPDVRLVYLVREPLSRIRSHYLHAVARYGERRPLSVAVRDDPEYLDITRYCMQIEQFLEYFDRSRLLVVTTEALRHERARTVSQVLEFVGADPSFSPPPTFPELNRSGDRRLDTTLSSRLRRLPGYERARRLVPTRVRRLSGRVVKRPLTAHVDMSMPDELCRRVRQELREDVAGLRAFLGPSFDGWGIA